MKKILHLFLFFAFFFTSFSQDIEKYNRILLEIEQVEKKITIYTEENFKKIKIPKSFLKDLKNDGASKEDIIFSIESYKKVKLREQFFKENPKYLSIYKQLTTRDLDPVPCINPGFEVGGGSTISYSFFQHQYGTPIVFDACGMDINTNTPIMPGSLNDMTAEVALVSAGYDPTLIAHSVYLCRTNSNCMSITERAIRLNNNITHDPSRSVVTMRKNIKITDDFFVFNFAAVMQSGHQNSSNIQPFFQVRIYDENGDLYNERCILADENDCIFIDATPHLQHNKILYSEWSCVKLNTSELIGQWVDIEFSITDCGLGGHFGYVYIDDLCQENCTSGYGYIDLHPLEEGGTCPEFPIDVCGEFSPPLAGTAQEGTLIDIWLNILENDDIVGTITDVTVTGNEFCFEVQESDFPDPMASQFEFQVVAEFEMNCTLTPYIITLTDISTNIGPDIKCSLWPRTYGSSLSSNISIKRKISDIEIDDEGNVYSVGYLMENDISYEDPSFISNGRGAIMKHDIQGNLEWVQYFPDYTYTNQLWDANQIDFVIELANNKLIVLTSMSYLIGYNLDGTTHFPPYQLNDYIMPRPNLAVNRTTGDIYVAVKYSYSFSNSDYEIEVLVTNVDNKIGVFKFNADGSYNGHSIIIGGSRTDIVFSENQDKLFLSGSIIDTATFPGSIQINNNFFGAEYNDDSVFSDSSFSSVVGFDDYVGILEYDDSNDLLFVDRGALGVQIFQFDFTDTNPTTVNIGHHYFDPHYRHFYFSHITDELYFSSTDKFGKINSGGLVWDKNNPIGVTNNAIAFGVNDYLYVSGFYSGDTAFGDFPIYDYYLNAGFIARLKEDGTSVEYRGNPGTNPSIDSLTTDQSFLLHPNPAKDKLNIEPIISKQSIKLLTMYDLSGVDILTIKSPYNDNNIPVTIEIDHLKSGIYILKIVDSHGEVEFYRVVKQ